VACVSYLNTQPLVAGLEKLPQIRLLPMVPSAIAGSVLRGEAELGLCSLVDCHRHGLVRLPVGMIACDGPTLTVRLLSNVPWQQVRTLHADTDSHTSVVLAQVLLKRAFGVQGVSVVPWKESSPGGHAPQTLLMIGDKVVLRASEAREYAYSLDLGEAWKQLTNLPFVYAMWATTPALAREERVHLAASLLDRQRRHNAGRLGWIVRTHAPRLGWPLPEAERYVQSLLRFGPDEQSELGAQTFLRYAVEDGLLAPAAHADELDSSHVQAHAHASTQH
jgi:predicted solute-binding protein